MEAAGGLSLDGKAHRPPNERTKHMLVTPQFNRPQASRQAAKTVTGQFLARATVNYPAYHRARDAARWIRGELTITPTLKLAAETFGVCVPLVAAARDALAREAQRQRSGAFTLSDSAVDNIVREIGVERMWAAIDRLTQPELNLVAAE
jgi:hypothetical protein